MTNSLLSWRERLLEAARDGVHDLGLLALRLWLAQEFVAAGLTKLSGGWQAPEWFAALQFPPLLRALPVDANWTLAGLGEVGLGLALCLGLFSRASALGLLFITWVAVYTVHFDLGWAGWNAIDTEAGQGFKVPLMMAVMLCAIVTQGGGRYAVDAWRQGRAHGLRPA
ncbi:MAG: DoxX family protein [Proteobacteria bacterium]|uniref:DoxX family protein n=1 Tax=Aquabacterium sp. TaxID=1872578 RepID=UPI0035C67C6E|nr:DoxX family protein [Pseudomonadota bacterium]